MVEHEDILIATNRAAFCSISVRWAGLAGGWLAGSGA
jgi:hypothetical protein